MFARSREIIIVWTHVYMYMYIGILYMYMYMYMEIQYVYSTLERKGKKPKNTPCNETSEPIIEE